MVSSKIIRMNIFIVITIDRMYVAGVVHETIVVDREEKFTGGIGKCGGLEVFMTCDSLGWIFLTGMRRWIKITCGPF